MQHKKYGHTNNVHSYTKCKIQWTQENVIGIDKLSCILAHLCFVKGKWYAGNALLGDDLLVKTDSR